MNRRIEKFCRGRIPQIAGVAIVVLGLWLVLFHLALFWQRVADATIGHPAVLLRWIASAVLIAAAVLIRRRCSTRGALGLVFWLVVLMLHAAIPADERLLSNDDVVYLIVQGGIAVVPSFLALSFAAGGGFVLPQTAVATPAAAGVFLPEPAFAVGPRAPPAC